MTAYAFFGGKYVPLAEAKIGVMTHAFNYGTGCFEGIRGYWNEGHQQLYVFRLREHFERLEKSCRILRIELPYSVDEMCQATLEVIARGGFREDVYIRPIAYKSDEIIGVRLHGLTDAFTVFATPFGKYIERSEGCRCCVSSWRRIDDNAMPARAKITGSYINAALMKTEAMENGFDEAISLTHDGHVCEGSAENLFMWHETKLVTPPVTDNILVGITRSTVMQLAREELGLETVERGIDRTELYVCDELFLCGTGVEVTPVIEVDRRPVGTGKMGPISRQVIDLYQRVVHGDVPRYFDWCAPVYAGDRAAAKSAAVASAD
jgi:branched-chain amino acid aminotransferase